MCVKFYSKKFIPYFYIITKLIFLYQFKNSIVINILFHSNNIYWEFLLWLSGLQTQLVSMRMQVQSLALQWVKDPVLPWCRLQIWLGSSIAGAVVQAGNDSLDWTPSLGTSIYHGCSPQKRPKKKRKRFLIHKTFKILHVRKK